MKLQEDSIRWAIKHIIKESDNDLFPRPYELNIIMDCANEIVECVSNIDLGNYKWKAGRRFLIPKDTLSFRNATQLDPFDSIIFSAIIYEFGGLIEAKRIAEDKRVVFSYRFKPLPDGTLYKNKKAWENFHKECKHLAESYTHVITCDISDFYNQINLHTIENQLIVCGFPNQVKNSLKELIISITQRSSKGIPIGPHGAHLLAEMSLIPFDENLNRQEIVFKRYVDDIVIFCNSEKEARRKLNTVADILDKEQRMILQKQKTKILSSLDFIDVCEQNLLEKPINKIESEIIEIINEHSEGDPYSKIKIGDIDTEELKLLSQDKIESLFDSYLRISTPNYERIRWLYRRLSQIGIASAVDYSIERFDKLVPALNDVCLYISSCAENYASNWNTIGAEIIDLFDDEIIESNEFYKIALMNLFVYNNNLNNIGSLIRLFNKVSGNIKRKILLASMNYNSASWLRTLKEHYNSFDDWTKRAYLIAVSKLPREEREYFYKGTMTTLNQDSYFEKIIINWAKKR